jgi:PAS domain S-box-containing protein
MVRRRLVSEYQWLVPRTLAFLNHSGPAAALIADFDWKSSSLGDPVLWPQSLKTAVGIVLGSGQACNLLWGPELITFYNDAYRPLLGTHVGDGIGVPYPVLRPDIWPSVEEQIMAGFAGKATSLENIRVLTRRHGEAEEAYFALSCSPVYDEAGTVAGVISHMFETTRNVQAQRALEDENSMLGRGFNHLPQMVWSTLPDGYHDFYNDPWYEFTGVLRGSTDGEGWNDMFHPEDRERAWSIWRDSLRTGKPYEIEYRLKHRDGSYRWTLGRASPERDEAGKIIRWYGTCTDIHELVLAREQVGALQTELIHLSRVSAMGSMAATLAHEVNQPLTAAASFASGLRRQVAAGAAPEILIEGIVGVEGAVLRAGEIIRRLMQMSEGRGTQKEAVSVADLVREARHLLKEQCAGAVIELNGEKGAIAYCDPVQIQQVLTNLIRNACEAAEAGEAAVIAIDASSDEERVRVSVSDNGPGLEAGREEAIFDALKPSRKGGMGIGLAICRTIVEAHGGTIRAENLTPRGARFYFDLPTIRGEWPKAVGAAFQI